MTAGIPSLLVQIALRERLPQSPEAFHLEIDIKLVCVSALHLKAEIARGRPPSCVAFPFLAAIPLRVLRKP